MKGAAAIAKLIAQHHNFCGNCDHIRRVKGGEYQIDGEWVLPVKGGEHVHAIITVNVYAAEK